ncbi:hypothetical protein DFAR_1720005 [Desulfarculales bacterium]
MRNMMGNINGVADRGQVDPAYECLCDLQMALDDETDPAERAVIQAEIDKIKAGK